MTGERRLATPPARTAGQRPLVALLAAGVVVLGGLQLAQSEQVRGGSDGDDAAGPVEEVAPEPGRSAQVVGPVRGASVSGYIEDRTAALADAPETVDTAVVSFTARLRLDDAVTLVGDATVRAVLVRLPLSTETATTVRVEAGADLAEAVRATLAGRVEPMRTELEQIRQLIDSGTVDDEAFVREYEQRAIELEEAVAAAEGGVAIVHALVLRAPLAQLQALQGQTGIRLVDPAPPGTDAGTSVFTGLLPADTDTVSEGRAG